MRTAILADKLLERGHTVLWWASAFDHLKKEWIFKKDTQITVKDSLGIIALKGIGYKKNISLSRFIDHRIIARKFKIKSTELPKPDIIVTSLPSYDLAFEAVLYAQKTKIPILVDIRDRWPDIFLNHVPSKLKSLVRFLLQKDFKMTRKTMQLADGLTAVNNTFLEWGLRYAGREKRLKDKVYYLGSFVNKVSSNSDNKISGLSELLKNKFVVTFIGTFTSYHDPSILLKCANKLSEYNITFIIAGDGELFKDLKKKALSLSNVTLTGWLNQNEITLLLQNSNIGICPTQQTIDLFPNKAFSYLSAGLPVVSSFQGELKDIIEKYEIGLYYPPNDVDALVSCINKLYEDEKLYTKMSINARKVFAEMFDADKIYNEYAEHIEQVVNDHKSKPIKKT